VVLVGQQYYPRGDACEIHVHGVSYRNSDGSSRQDIINRLSRNDPLRLIPEPSNHYDKHAVQVMSRYGMVGYVPADMSAKIATRLSAGASPNVFVQWVAGGSPSKPELGLGIIVDFDTEPEWLQPVASQEPTSMSIWGRVARLFHES